MTKLGYHHIWNIVLLATPQREYWKTGIGAEKGIKVSIEQPSLEGKVTTCIAFQKREKSDSVHTTRK